jgi:hypothetical protein
MGEQYVRRSCQRAQVAVDEGVDDADNDLRPRVVVIRVDDADDDLPPHVFFSLTLRWWRRLLVCCLW